MIIHQKYSSATLNILAVKTAEHQCYQKGGKPTSLAPSCQCAHHDTFNKMPVPRQAKDIKQNMQQNSQTRPTKTRNLFVLANYNALP